MSVGWVSAGISAVGVVGGLVAGNKAAKNAAKATDSQIALQQQQQDIANEQWSTYKDTYQPLEKAMVADAQSSDNAAAYARAANDAQATTMQQIGLAQARLSRTPGFDPSSAAAQAASTDLALRGAALSANGQNAARDGVRDKAWARKMDALGLGKGLVTGASNGLAQASSTAGAIASAQQANAVNTASGTASMITGLGNTFLNAYQKSNTPVVVPQSSLPALQQPTMAPMGVIDING